MICQAESLNMLTDPHRPMEMDEVTWKKLHEIATQSCGSVFATVQDAARGSVNRQTSEAAWTYIKLGIQEKKLNIIA